MTLDGKPGVRLIPLGGLGEIGMNCLALECQEQILIIDCGTTFPHEDVGVDVVHPRFDWLLENAARVVGVYITHAHEDHIGGLPYLLSKLHVPVWAPKHALRLIEQRLVGWGEVGLALLRDTKFYAVQLRREFHVGCFTLEPVRVSHSIVDATAVCVQTPGGCVVHTGDFKFDSSPLDGECTDEERLMQWGERGVDLLLSDSTNIDSPGFSGSEADVEVALDARIRDAQGRVVVSLFASNVQRLIAIGRIAERRGRRVCLLGRSLALHVEVARKLGYLHWPESLILAPERLRTYPPKEVIVLASGTQSEPGSAMVRFAERSHWALDLSAGDLVLFSSRVIPGNERAVSGLVDGLLRLGVSVVGREDRGLHVSGHAYRGEQQHMLELVNPRCFVPVHGTRHHLERHAALAREVGVRNVSVIENGQTLWLRGEGLRGGADVVSGKVAVGFDGGAVEPQVLKERRELGRAGSLVVAMICDSSNRFTGAATLSAVAISAWSTREQLHSVLAALLSGFRGRRVEAALSEEIRRSVLRVIEPALRSRPLVTISVVTED